MAAASVSGVLESSCFGVQLKVGGIPHLRLNTATIPIANKCREMKVAKNFEEEEFKRT